MKTSRFPIVVLAIWAVVATAAAVYLATRPDPVVPPPPEPVGGPPAETPPLPAPQAAASGGIPLAALLSLAVQKPAAEATENMPERMRSIVAEILEMQFTESWTVDRELEISREMYSFTAYEPKSHLVLMEMLKEARTEDEVHEVLSFLVWSPFARMSRHSDVVDAVCDQACEMIVGDPDVNRRIGAVRVLFRYGDNRYGDHGRDAMRLGLERLRLEPSVEVRDVLLDEMSVLGRDRGLSREEVEPLVSALRARMEEGKVWCANALSGWSDDPQDFRRIRGLLEVEPDQDNRQTLTEAFSGGGALVQGREEEARALLVSVMSDPTEDPRVRGNARTVLFTHGPLTAEEAEAVRRFNAENN